MWKFISRRTKDYWRKNAYSPKVQTEPQRKLCCFPEAGQCKGNKESTDEKRGKRQTWETNTQVQQHSWIGALGWSGILVVGWYLSQPSRLRSLIGCSVQPEEARYKSSLQILLHPVCAQPIQNVVHQVVPKPLKAAEEPIKDTSQIVLDTLDQAADSFAQVHGSVENRLGVELAKRKCHKEAVALFEKATSRRHPTAAFNLGLCHELGLGTTQDFSKAAECYEIASLGGHATATYNLGVFYVHGWGGKKSDCVQAKKLFVLAAQLGQTDARRALGMVEPQTQRTVPDKVTNLSYKDDPITKLVNETKHKYIAMLET